MAKKLPAVPDSTQQDTETTLKEDQKKLRVLKKQKKQIKELEDEADKDLKRIEDNMSKTFKFICALRLDMVADVLERIDKKLAWKIDTIANEIEKATWE